MKTLVVPFLPKGAVEPWSALGHVLSSTEGGERLAECPWPEFPYRPDVRFAMGHDETAIHIAFRVRERAVLAQKTRTNEAVSEDSCVELFISPGEDGLYYNFEFSCIGTCLAGVGLERHGRTLLPEQVVEKIVRRSTLGSAPIPIERAEEADWELFATIPLEVFVRHQIGPLTSRRMKANLYKCGDRLSLPHYVTWNRVESPRPDYHRPEWFGELDFA